MEPILAKVCDPLEGIWDCRVMERSKLNNLDIFKSLANSMKFSENIKSEKLFYVNFPKR